MKVAWWLPAPDWMDLVRRLLDRGICAQVHFDHNVLLADPLTKRFSRNVIGFDVLVINGELFPVPDGYVEYDSVYHRWNVRLWQAMQDLFSALTGSGAIMVAVGGQFARYLATRKGVVPSNVDVVYVELPWGWEVVKRVDSYGGAEQYHDIWDVGDYVQRALYYYVARRIASRGFQCSSDFVVELPFLRKRVRVTNGVVVDGSVSPSAIEVGLTPLATVRAYGSHPATAWLVRVSNPNSYNLVDHQVRIDLSSVLPAPTYLMIIDDDGNSVTFCFEQDNGECTASPSRVVWVRIPRIPAGGSVTLTIMRTTINRARDGNAVFDFYDDFGLGVVDTNKWDRYDDSYFVVRGDQLVVRDGSAFRYIVSKQGFAPPIVVEARIRFIEGMDADGSIAILNGSNGNWSRGYSHAVAGLAGSGTYSVVYFTPTQGISNVCRFSATGTEMHVAGYIVRSASEIEAFTYASGTRQSCTISTSDFGNVYVAVVDDTWHDGAYQNKVGDQTIIDWIRVRKYADAEPVVEVVGDNSIDGEVEQAIAVLSFNPPIVIYGVDPSSDETRIDALIDVLLALSRSANASVEMDLARLRNIVLSLT